MKKIAVFLVFCLFVFSLEAMTLVEDRIGLLSETEKEYVLSALDKASRESGLSLGVVIANGSEGKGDMAFADDFYDGRRWRNRFKIYKFVGVDDA